MGITNEGILKIAMEQSAIDAGCDAGVFLKRENVTVLSRVDPRARKYLTLPFECQLISYGNNVVASVSEKYRALVTDYINPTRLSIALRRLICTFWMTSWKRMDSGFALWRSTSSLISGRSISSIARMR